MNVSTAPTSTMDSIPNITTGVGRVMRPRGGPPVDPDYYVVPEDIVDLIKKVCYLGICPVLLIAGIIMNAICLVMFVRLVKTSKTSTVIFLLTMAITDLVYIAMASIHVLFVSSGYYEFPFSMNQRTQAVPYFYSYIRPIPGRFGAVLTMIISIERLFCVIHPIKIRQYSTRKNAVIIVLISFALVVICNFPLILINRPQKMYSNFTGVYYIIVPTEFGKNTELADFIYLIVEVLFGFIPVFGVTVACAIIIAVLVASGHKRTQMTKTSTRHLATERSVTKTLLSLIGLFIICKLPATILGLIIFIYMKPYKYTNNVYDVARAVTYVPLLVNAVVNLLIYYKASSVYRAYIRRMFGCAAEITKLKSTSTKSQVVAIVSSENTDVKQSE